MSEKIDFTLQAKAIRVDKFSTLDNEIEKLNNPEWRSKVDLNLATKIDLNEENHLTTVSLAIKYHYRKAVKDFLEMIIEMDFKTEPFDKIVTKNDEGGLRFLDDNIAIMLAGITFSTARGILYEKTKKTNMENFPLPVINPQFLFSNREKVISEVGSTT